MHQPVHQRLRRRDAVRLDDLREQRLTHLGIGLAGGLALQVLPDRRAQRVEVLEVADLAGERVVERRQLLPLHLVERDPHLAGLAAPGLVGVILREAHLGIGALAGSSVMIRSSRSGIAWFWPRTRS